MLPYNDRRIGDWDCPSCNHMNFARRESCRACGTFKPGKGPPEPILPPPSDLNSTPHFTDASRPGDWNCASCQHLNFARRENCRQCGKSCKELPFTPTFAGRPPDWPCNICQYINFGRNRGCKQCGASKPHHPGPVTQDYNYNEPVYEPLNFLPYDDFPRLPSPPPFGNYGGRQSFGDMNGMGGGYSRNPYDRPPGNYSSHGGGGALRRHGQMKPGDWMCPCGEYVFSSRSECRMCGASKPQPDNRLAGSGEWTCECGEQNYIKRSQCRGCLGPRPYFRGNEGRSNEGFRNEGYRGDDGRNEGFNDGYQNDGYRNDGYQNQNNGYRNEGQFRGNDGRPNEEFRNEGFRNEGFRNEGFRNEGFRGDGQQQQYQSN